MITFLILMLFLGGAIVFIGRSIIWLLWNATAFLAGFGIGLTCGLVRSLRRPPPAADNVVPFKKRIS